MAAYDPTSDANVQVPDLRDTAMVRLGRFFRRVAPQFGWPMIVLFLLGPLEGAWNHNLLVTMWVFVSFPLILLGLTLRIWSKGFFREEGFVVDGPYRYVRNPVELGALLCYLGCGLLMGLKIYYICGAVFVAFVYLSIAGRAFDRDLETRYGAPFLRYTQRIKRWMPNFIPGTNRSNRNFSLLHALSFEWRIIFWVLAFFVALAGRRHFSF